MKKLHLWEDLSGEYPIRIGTFDTVVNNGSEFRGISIEDGTYYYDSHVNYSDLAILETETKTRVDYNKLERTIEIDRNVTLAPYVWPVTFKGITAEEFLNSGFSVVETIKIKNAIGSQSVFTPTCNDMPVIYRALGTALGAPASYSVGFRMDDVLVLVAEEQVL